MPAKGSGVAQGELNRQNLTTLILRIIWARLKRRYTRIGAYRKQRVVHNIVKLVTTRLARHMD